MKLANAPNRKLNSFLEIAKIPTKIDTMTIYEHMDLMRLHGSDLTETIKYCLWDAYSLTLIMDTVIQYV